MEKEKRERERIHAFFIPFCPFHSSILFPAVAGWRSRELEPEDEDEKRREAGTGWSHNAADIAKELHVTREFVYTVSVPLPSSGNVH